MSVMLVPFMRRELHSWRKSMRQLPSNLLCLVVREPDGRERRELELDLMQLDRAMLINDSEQRKSSRSASSRTSGNWTLRLTRSSATTRTLASPRRQPSTRLSRRSSSRSSSWPRKQWGMKIHRGTFAYRRIVQSNQFDDLVRNNVDLKLRAKRFGDD